MKSQIILDHDGGYLRSWRIEGREVLYQGSEKKRSGIPVLFPNYDLGDPLPRHGFGRLSTWQVVSAGHLRLTNLDLTPDFRQVYPHQFTIDIKVFSKNNSLDYQLIVNNLGSLNLPISPGLHPYWPIAHSQKNQIKTNLKGFTLTPDVDYDFPNIFVAQFPDYRLTIEDISQPKLFPIMHYWSQDQSFPDSNFACFEPLTRSVNGINLNPLIIKPKETLVFRLSFTVDFVI